MENDFLKLKLDNYKPLREVVFKSIRGAIISGVLKPGERLMEVQLAEKLGVSRTPVREAIRKLELEGLIIMLPRKGAYVADISAKDITDVLEIRAALEGLASALAASRITDEEIKELNLTAIHFHQAIEDDDFNRIVQMDIEFHDRIFKAARNERLLQINNNLREQVQRFRIMYISKSNKSKDLVKEHYGIAEAISRRNIEMADKLAKTHIENAEKYIMNTVENMAEDNQELQENGDTQ